MALAEILGYICQALRDRYGLVEQVGGRGRVTIYRRR